MKAELVPDNGDPPIPITRDLTVIGRRDYCDVYINDPSLSKRHAVVVKTDGLLVIRDLATTNGTKVKGQRIRWAALLPEDRISLGAYKMKVYLGPDDQPSPSERRARTGPAARPVLAAPPPIGAIRDAGFPSPSPIVVPTVASEQLEILDDEDSGDSGWRQLIKGGRQGGAAGGEDDVLIELD